MLICFNVYKGRKTFNKVERQYHLLSKENGWLTPIAINIKYPISNTVLTSTSIDRAHTRGHMFGIPSKTIIKNGTNVIISDYGSDTIYLKNNKGLHPLIAKYPSVQDNEEPTLVYALARTDKYTFLRKIIRRRENNGMTDFVVENQTGEIFELKITNQDFPSKNFIIETFGMNLPQNTVYSLLPTNAYIERNEKKQLSGKLKELVSTLTDDDNNFLISIKYR